MLDVPYALAIGAGMVATVNPCGFAMLPAYLGFFVGTDDGESRALRDRIARALVVSAMMTVGFVTVFGIVGLLVQMVAQSIDDHLSKVTIGIGILLVLLGLWLLTGHELRINGPKLQRGGRDRTLVSMYLFGVSYATASLSCTLGPFLVALTPTFRHSGTASGLLAFVAYALGMGLVVASATVALAGAQQTWITRLRNLGPIINRVSGALLILAGLYVAWYGYWELQGDFAADPIVDGAARIQTWLTNRVADLPRWPLAVVLVLALAAVVLARRRRHSTTAIKGLLPNNDHPSTHSHHARGRGCRGPRGLRKWIDIGQGQYRHHRPATTSSNFNELDDSNEPGAGALDHHDHTGTATICASIGRSARHRERSDRSVLQPRPCGETGAVLVLGTTLTDLQPGSFRG